MTISPDNEEKTSLGAAGRPALLVALLTAAMLVIAVSCGGGDGDDDDPPGTNRDSDREVTMSTFTPTVEGAIPEIQQTAEARQTASAEAATEVAENPPPPTSTPDPNYTPPPGQTPEVDENALRPPFVWLSDGTDQMDGVFGDYSWIDEETETYAFIQAPFYDVGDDGLTVDPGAELEFILQDDVAPPTSIEVSVFTWADNNAIPGDTEGNVMDHPFFVPNPESAPLSTNQITLDDPSFTMPAEADRYVVRVALEWPPDDRLEEGRQRIFAVYAFTVYVA